MPRHHDTRSNGSINGEAEAETSSAKTRRSHRKSRNGCRECKRRHIRCDEGRPACTNCSIAERTCAYPLAVAAQKTPSSATSTPQALNPANSYPGSSGHGQVVRPVSREPPSRTLSTSTTPTDEAHRSTPLTTATTPAATTLPSFHEAFDTNRAPLQQAVSFTAQHMALFHHMMTSMNGSIMATEQLELMLSIAVRTASEAPYLMDQVLALSAMHCARIYPASAATYRDQATELQNRAVASFTRETETLPSQMHNCIPRFLFSSTLGLHVLCDTLAFDRLDFHAFIDRFVECINLHRGVRIVLSPNWESLNDLPELEPLFRATKHAHPGPDAPSGTECALLERYMAESDLTPTSVAACREAVSTLQNVFDMFARMDDQNSPHAASAFAITVPSGYVEVLRRHRPEALIVLAYYGVLLHRSRRFWVFGLDTGSYVIRAIEGHLGSYWNEAMRWPLEVLEKETD